jgi:hypothetical protein
MSDKRENLIVKGHEKQWLLPNGGMQYIPLVRPAPCIVILVHGVNDIGEAFPFQEKGICKGLNQRLDRGNDMQPANYTLPLKLKKGEKFGPQDVHPDPDKVYFARSGDSSTSPVIPFLWGFREVSVLADTKQKHGEYLDQYGNRIDKRFAKNGGPFANATNNIPDMFGPGFDRNWGISGADPESATHPLLNAPPRAYMVLAAQRLASLIRIIRKKSPNEPINIVAHSQGCFVSILAHAILAKEGNIKADTLILNNWPYSVDDPTLEMVQAGFQQQTTKAREETLIGIIKDFITNSPATEPKFSELKTKYAGLVGAKWQYNANKERDNRGKVYLYFSPDDQTVGLGNIQGIGWWGLNDAMLARLGGRFLQRVFTAQKDSEKRPIAIGQPPSRVKLSFEWSMAGGITTRKDRHINAEELPIPFTPGLGAATLINSPIDAAIAVANPYDGKKAVGMRPGETPEAAKARWMSEFNKNSYHSSIVSNPMHSEWATSQDLCIGVSGILKGNDLTWINFLRAVADWRTNWHGGELSRKIVDDPSFPPPDKKLIDLLKNNKEVDLAERKIIEGNYNYYCISGINSGELPKFTTDCTVNSLFPFVKSETISQSWKEEVGKIKKKNTAMEDMKKFFEINPKKFFGDYR